MSESGVALPAFGGLESTLLWLVFAAGACALGYGWWLIGRVLRHSAGPASMQAVAAAIQEGAEAYLGRQFRTMLLFIAAITIALYVLYRPIYLNPALAWGIALAFLGGGIYTKVADVGADLVGKVEVGIPEDDPRNAATIADNVGDNVGDCAGMAADVFESYEVTLVAAIILGAGTLLDPHFRAVYGPHASGFALKLILFPLLIQGIGVFASILGTRVVKARGEEIGDPMPPINHGLWVSALAAIAGFAVVNAVYLTDPNTGAPDWRFSSAALTGLILALVIKW